ncbi:glycoside hydrolase family 75 protein [Acidovorax sp.]|uniref:glycoside hydrolase family 75 protein n=1 Tax=Acidovorax sp. TaxID=1872122 RepID=UPI001AC5E66D|nr:glycoside hydrolase family 75 protein [Acidovorax sp.]MBN9626056.1 hypothetical protein [Acidovorax sp.]
MAKVLGSIAGVEIYEDPDGRVWYRAGASIDADGANGQHGQPVAYNDTDTGTDYLQNGGMRLLGGRVVRTGSSAIAILGPDGQPRVFPNGVIASKTWYQFPDVPADDPSAYVDSETVPYIVVPPFIVKNTVGVVRGCRATATYGDVTVECVVADKGPSNRIGEISIAAARALGINPSPKNGGLEKPLVNYELWPGVAADGYVLQPA